MSLDVWCKTDKGLRRESNQDSYLINKDLGLFIVADGMGGHSGGEVASALAVQTVEEVIKKPAVPDLSPKDLLVYAYTQASRRIYEKAQNENPELMGMGTTMVLVYRSGSSLYIANVGDSRVYLFRRPHLWQLTEDHSLVNEQLRAGLITEEQLKTVSGKNVITRSVGYEPDVVVDVIERPLTRGDVFLLCSDGLHGLVIDQKICELLNKNTLDKVVDRCIDQALANGGDDNVTVMTVAVK
ncbi:MAG: hypothetical protein BroJett040_03630 [Oligoflexia bacterium]|nr:MAG: hypothetical protein BroJett040_03630 [Oligoflexia bacterium]